MLTASERIGSGALGLRKALQQVGLHFLLRFVAEQMFDLAGILTSNSGGDLEDMGEEGGGGLVAAVDLLGFGRPLGRQVKRLAGIAGD